MDLEWTRTDINSTLKFTCWTQLTEFSHLPPWALPVARSSRFGLVLAPDLPDPFAGLTTYCLWQIDRNGLFQRQTDLVDLLHSLGKNSPNWAMETIGIVEIYEPVNNM